MKNPTPVLLLKKLVLRVNTRASLKSQNDEMQKRSTKEFHLQVQDTVLVKIPKGDRRRPTPRNVMIVDMERNKYTNLYQLRQEFVNNICKEAVKDWLNVDIRTFAA